MSQARDADEEAEFLAEYRRRRMEEMRRSLEASATRFDGLGVVELTAANFLQHVDPPNVPANATVVLHVYDARESACKRLNRCLIELCTRLFASQLPFAFSLMSSLFRDVGSFLILLRLMLRLLITKSLGVRARRDPL